MLGKSSIKWRQHPDMIIAVDWDVKHQFKFKKFYCRINSFLRHFSVLLTLMLNIIVVRLDKEESIWRKAVEPRQSATRENWCVAFQLGLTQTGL